MQKRFSERVWRKDSRSKTWLVGVLLLSSLSIVGSGVVLGVGVDVLVMSRKGSGVIFSSNEHLMIEAGLELEEFRKAGERYLLLGFYARSYYPSRCSTCCS